LLRIDHRYKNIHCKGKADDSSSFIITNKQGGFAFFSPQVKTRYQGLFFKEKDDLFKTIESILVFNSLPVSQLRNHFWNMQFVHGKSLSPLTETFFYFNGTNTMFYDLNKPSVVELVLDCRKIFDNRSFGRFYSLYTEENKIIIEFDKKNDWQEPFQDEYKIFVVISGDFSDMQALRLWNHYYYEHDALRHSYPSDRFRYSAFRVKCSKLIITQGTDKSLAMKENDDVALNLSTYIESRRRSVEHLFDEAIKKPFFRKIPHKNLKLAYLCALNSVDSLSIKKTDQGLYAGIPWFVQLWSRDELISIKSLFEHDKPDFVKAILAKNFSLMTKNGRLSNRKPATDLGNADSIGFHFLRYQEFLESLKEKKHIGKYYDDKELAENIKLLKKSISDLYLNHFDEGLISNNALETWMDTDYANDNRQGHRIEIQALTLRSLSFLYDLTKDKKIKKLENELWQHTVLAFWNHFILKDGKDDETIRPNLFIAYYVYPKLIFNDEWITAFDNALLSLWQDFGGFSTIDKSNRLFQPLSTGEDNRSYHRGDVWYWINCIAAISMYRLDKNRYRNYINKIISASINDILFQGAIASASEISSAIEQKPSGCYSQLWSSALFVELVEEIYRK